MSRKILIGIYTDPQGYPPTLNAITELSTCFENIDVLYRPHIDGMWAYPVNVNLHPSGKLMSARAQEQSRLYKKVFFFLMFTWRLLRLGLKHKPKVFLMYDNLALFSYFLVRPFFLLQHKIWFHSHDVHDIQMVRKFSIGWFSIKSEIRNFSKLDIFSLPSSERLKYYNMTAFTGKLFVLPNYPAKSFYNTFYRKDQKLDVIRILYQGRVSEGHGIEDILQTIATFNVKNWRLVLKGECNEEYKIELCKLAEELKVFENLEFHGYIKYGDLPKSNADCHIGNAIYEEINVMNSTIGTASNKIYEYAALGFPVLYLANTSAANTLSQYNWAFPVTLNPDSIYQAVNKIMSHYALYSDEARKSFEGGLNFESHFQPVIDYLEKVV